MNVWLDWSHVVRIISFSLYKRNTEVRKQNKENVINRDREKQMKQYCCNRKEGQQNVPKHFLHLNHSQNQMARTEKEIQRKKKILLAEKKLKQNFKYLNIKRKAHRDKMSGIERKEKERKKKERDKNKE